MCACGYGICSLNVFFLDSLADWKNVTVHGDFQRRRQQEYWRMRGWSHVPILRARVYFLSSLHRLVLAQTRAWNNERRTKAQKSKRNLPLNWAHFAGISLCFPYIITMGHQGASVFPHRKKKKAFLFLAILFVCFFFGGTSSPDLTKTLKKYILWYHLFSEKLAIT